MSYYKPSYEILTTLKRQILVAICICYIPHILTEPIWLFLLFLSAISYRLIADYFNYPIIPRWARIALVIGCLFLLSSNIGSSEFLIRFMLIFIILKCLEIQTLRDIKVLIICNFFLIFSALIVVREPWVIIYLVIALIANLSIMLKMSASQVSLRQIGGKSSQQLLIAVPLSILLFFIFPRLDPLWHISANPQGNIGFNETMSPGSISELYNDDTTVMHITFTKTPIVDGYWRGIILNLYTGKAWYPAANNFSPLPNLYANEPSDYQILLEPHQKKWLFYRGYPVAAESNLSFAANLGLIRQNNEIISQSFAYSLKVKSTPYQALSATEKAEAIQLPNSNPRLAAWSKTEFAKAHNDIKVFLNFLHNYIHEQPFWYTLTPPALIENLNQMDIFWFDTKKGFCEHYASAVAFILRAAGIPAHVVVGYQGGQWNPLSHVLTIQRNNAHAWLEYWQEGIGWQQLDPTTFIAEERIDKNIRSMQSELGNQEVYFNFSDLLFSKKIKYVFESVRFFSQRWLLYYNQNTQQNLLQNFGLGRWKKEDLLQASLGCIILFFILVGIYYHWWQKRRLDKLLVEYHLLQKEFLRFKIPTPPSATLNKQCQALINKLPPLAPLVSSFMNRYEQLRLQQPNTHPEENKKEVAALFKSLRRTLRKEKVTD